MAIVGRTADLYTFDDVIDAPDLFTRLKYEAAATEPPYTPHPDLKLMEEPWTPRSAEVKRPIEADVANQKRFGIKKRHPSMAHLALAQLRAIIAAGIAGAWDRFGGLGARLSNAAEVLEVAPKTNQETAAKLVDGAKPRMATIGA